MGDLFKGFVMTKREEIKAKHKQAMDALPKAQRAIVEYIANNTDLWHYEIAQFSKSAMRELVKQGIIEKHFSYSPSNYYYDFSWEGRNIYYLDGILDDLALNQVGQG